jgi:Putative metal-binding motif
MLLRRALVLAIVVSVAACANANQGASDAAVDGPPHPCETVVCQGLTYCNDLGACMPFASCPTSDAGVSDGDGGIDPGPMCPPEQTCRNGFCLPDDRDFDNDGHPASTDCDETNPQVNPGAPEVCNGIDDDCVAGADDADPMAMCALDDTGEICQAGDCVCLPGRFDLDPAVPDCECVAAPPLELGASCATAIDAGQFPDGGTVRTMTANVPNGRRVFYRFRAVDATDTSCDNFHVRAALIANPTDQYKLRMMRGACSEAEPADATTYEWALDFRATIAGQLAGQCPCWTGTPVDNVSPCADDSADFYVVVERAPQTPNTCDNFTIELSNGQYDWM